MPGPSETEDRPGVVTRVLGDARHEYLVDVGGREVRVRRNRLQLDVPGDPEEGFSLPEHDELGAYQGWELATTFFKIVGEQAIGLKSRMPISEPSVTLAQLSLSHTLVASEKSQAWAHAHAPTSGKTQW